MEVIIEANRKSVEIEKQNSTGQSINIGTSYTEKLLANDYITLKNQPKIEGVTLINNKTFKDLGATSLTNLEIEKLINSQV